jgi:hypothetical protein
MIYRKSLVNLCHFSQPKKSLQVLTKNQVYFHFPRSLKRILQRLKRGFRSRVRMRERVEARTKKKLRKKKKAPGHFIPEAWF